MSNKGKTLLVVGAAGSAIAALAHVGCIIFGAEWYRFFGAGEDMAQMAERGEWYPAAVTSVLVLVLSLWALYGLSGAGVIRRLPLLRLGLMTISAGYLLRGVAFVGIMPMFPENSLTFWLVSSAICLSLGLLYAVGTYRAWPLLSEG
ncbi:MAG: hypothetical protein JXQ97_03910 [Natronospirillum sp.]